MLPRALRNLTDLKDYNGCHATAADCPSPPLHAKGSIKGTMPLLTAVEPTDGVALNERGADAVAFDGLGVERVDGHEHACNMIQGVRSIYLTHANIGRHASSQRRGLLAVCVPCGRPPNQRLHGHGGDWVNIFNRYETYEGMHRVSGENMPTPATPVNTIINQRLEASIKKIKSQFD